MHGRVISFDGQGGEEAPPWVSKVYRVCPVHPCRNGGGRFRSSIRHPKTLPCYVANGGPVDCVVQCGVILERSGILMLQLGRCPEFEDRIDVLSRHLFLLIEEFSQLEGDAVFVRKPVVRRSSRRRARGSIVGQRHLPCRVAWLSCSSLLSERL